MATPTDAASTYDLVGNRESLADIIYDVSPMDTPFISSIPRVQASSTYHEWQTDSLAAAAQNAHIEGEDATNTTPSPTTRLGNYMQIAKKVPSVTNTQRIVSSAGRQDDLDYQIMKMGNELKRDMEKDVLDNNAQVAGNESTARELAGAPTWLTSNTDAGSGGSDAAGTGADARTDGTQRAFAESQLKTVLSSIWDNGGNPDIIMAGSFNKQAMSAFSGGATRTVDASDKRLNAAIDVYVSDFGELAVVPNRFMRARDCLVIQSDMWALPVLRDFDETPLAKVGDSDRVQLVTEYSLQCSNEAASGGVFDLTTS
jgi:hypothetical protein